MRFLQLLTLLLPASFAAAAVAPAAPAASLTPPVEVWVPYRFEGGFHVFEHGGNRTPRQNNTVNYIQFGARDPYTSNQWSFRLADPYNGAYVLSYGRGGYFNAEPKSGTLVTLSDRSWSFFKLVLNPNGVWDIELLERPNGERFKLSVGHAAGHDPRAPPVLRVSKESYGFGFLHPPME
ncbi:predicted protein [Uncinocarpus reesii 1704]|uniref:Uncharacterized protein n=1 Tax=Uncinocarpus reesii (strain UAMH 1704) TaxID=336963 RepID=C4K066_UNCRE|nr:uncharacterized protein UREG_07817 [Uncinocarpus reesii 1704]EEP82952.1 predicted protein [Uncinocarpus reesii 1704]